MNNPYLKHTTSINSDFRFLINQLDAELRVMYNELMDTYDKHNVIEEIDTVIVAYIDETPIGCGCFKAFSQEAVEIKRMFVHPSARGQGIGKFILAGLEAWASQLGFRYTVLETGSKNLEALSLYKKSGYVTIPKYEPYIDLPDSLCFKKLIV